MGPVFKELIRVLYCRYSVLSSALIETAPFVFFSWSLILPFSSGQIKGRFYDWRPSGPKLLYVETVGLQQQLFDIVKIKSSNFQLSYISKAVLPAVPWSPRVLYASSDTERMLSCIKYQNRLVIDIDRYQYRVNLDYRSNTTPLIALTAAD